MRSSRLLSLLMLLQARQQVSAAELAETLEVSERTILRDIDQLSAAGVPVWAERGRNGGFRLLPGWSTALTGLTEPEAKALFLAGLPGAATELGLGSAALSARLKVLASLPAEWRDEADRVAAHLHVDTVDWYRAHETPRFLKEVAEAVWSARAIEVRYESWQGDSERTLHPLGLVLKAGVWYLVARSPGTQRISSYRLANLLALRTAKGGFERPKGFDLAAHWSSSVERFEAGLVGLHASVRVSPLGLQRLTNLRWRATPVKKERRDPAARPGWREVRIPIESIEHGARQLLTLGRELEVLEPPELRVEIARIARHLVELHAEPLAPEA